MSTPGWSEKEIASYLTRFTFTKKALVIVPRCSWTGSECDLLVLTPDRRVIDVEIKISRADLRADAKKEKWFHAWDFAVDGPWQPGKRGRVRQWPERVWKHYYAAPRDIWTPDLADAIPQASGVLLLGRDRFGELYVRVERMAKPCRDADRVSPEDCLDIARLCCLRMYAAFDDAERARRELRGLRAEAA